MHSTKGRTMRNITDISPWCDDSPGTREIDLSRFRIAGNAEAIIEIVHKHGIIDIGRDDILTALTATGTNYVVTGMGHGESRIENALDAAIGQLTIPIESVKTMIINIYTDTRNPITMPELSSFSKYIERICPGVNMMWGVTTDDNVGENVKITLVAIIP